MLRYAEKTHTTGHTLRIFQRQATMHFTLFTVAVIGLSLPNAFATGSLFQKREGINCEGSSDCEAEKKAGGTIQAIADAMTTAISNGEGGNFYSEGR